MQIGTYAHHSMGPTNVQMDFDFATTTSVGALASTAINAPRGLGNTTVTYAATGIYTVALPFGSTFPNLPLTIRATPQAATLATDWFDCLIVGTPTQTAGVLQFVIQCHRSGTAQAPAATAGNAIHVTIVGSNNTGG